MIEIIKKYLSCGLSVIPCDMKRPLITWKPYQNAPVTHKIAETWSGYTQIALVCGKVSGGLLCMDFDTKNGDKYNDWIMLINEQYPELLSKMVIEQSPSGGYHVCFLTDMKTSNWKLANNLENKCTIETRGDGGYFVCAPSPNYVLQYSDFEHLQKLTIEETEICLTAARSFNELTQNNPQKEAEYPRNFNGISPFDDYNSRHDVVGLLQKHGWKLIFNRGEKAYLQRPGKNERSISATWNAVPDRFYVFSTSTVFENNHIYKPSAVYAILEHNGDYSAAAKELSRLGYGKTEESKTKQEKKTYQVTKVNTNAIINKIYDIQENGYQCGKTTGWQSLDKLYSIIKGQFTVITGMPSGGKSEFMDALAVNLMAKEHWKFAVFSPENYPIEMHYHKLIEKIVGKELREISKEEIDIAVEIINSHFFFIDAIEEDINLEVILGQTEQLIKEHNIDGLIIDPWNEIELSKPRDISDSDFIGVCLRKIRKFARKHRIHLWIVAHPIKMQKDKDGNYPIPELYDIAGSAHWRNKADNGICVHRNYENETTTVIVQKIKFRYAGKPGEVIFKYNERSGRYEETGFDNSMEDRFYK